MEFGERERERDLLYMTLPHIHPTSKPQDVCIPEVTFFFGQFGIGISFKDYVKEVI
jgi:hypothetical protein